MKPRSTKGLKMKKLLTLITTAATLAIASVDSTLYIEQAQQIKELKAAIRKQASFDKKVAQQKIIIDSLKNVLTNGK